MTAKIRLERETQDHVPVVVTADGEVTNDFEVAVTRWPARPTTWTQAVVAAGEPGVVVSGLSRGTYQVWARVASTVVEAGTIEVE